MTYMKNIRGLLCGLLAAMLCLSACGSTKPAGKPSETGGVGRNTVQTLSPDTAEISDAVIPDNSQETDASVETSTAVNVSASSVPSYTVQDGKYVYSFPAPDRSALSDLSDINAMSNALFNDNAPGDTSGSWYPGKTQRDLTTGEVSYVWDRSKETLAALEKYNGIYRQHEDEKVIYLTFDCGYENGWTDPILDILKEKNAPGLFFLTGHYVETAEPQIRRMLDEGHIIGNHTADHINSTQVSAEEFIEEIEELEQMVKDRFPDSPPIVYFRPPYGACNERSLALANKMGLYSVLWSWAYEDYNEDSQMDPAVALEKAKQGLHNGAVYLFHTVGSTNAAILGDFIDYVRAQGYEIRPIMG